MALCCKEDPDLEPLSSLEVKFARQGFDTGSSDALLLHTETFNVAPNDINFPFS